MLDERERILTCSTDTSCSITSQPSLSSLYLHNLRDLSTVILSIGFQYLRAKTIMSWIEFQHMTTSQGISLSLRPWAWQNCRHAGRAMVVNEQLQRKVVEAVRNKSAMSDE